MILKNAKVVNDQFQFEFSDIQIKDGKIQKISENLSGEDERDFSGLTIIPGLFDIHTHECVGHQLCDCTQDTLQEMALYYAKNGTTSYLATLDSQDKETLYSVCRELGTFQKTYHDGAIMQGVHLEGLFFNEKRKGGHPAELLLPPDVELVHKLDELCGKTIRMVCVAPEIDGAEGFIKALANEMVVSIAHTDATMSQAKAGVRWGAKNFTHLFNGMRGFTHREPGTVGGAFDSPSTFKEIIADGMHLNPATVRMAVKIVGPDKLIFVSDSCVATGLEDGVYSIGSKVKRKIEVKNQLAHLEGTDTICGSTYCLYKMFKNAVQNIGIDFITALKACTINPASLVGLDHQIGSIANGKSADLIVIDNDLNIVQVYVRGEEQVLNHTVS